MHLPREYEQVGAAQWGARQPRATILVRGKMDRVAGECTSCNPQHLQHGVLDGNWLHLLCVHGRDSSVPIHRSSLYCHVSQGFAWPEVVHVNEGPGVLELADALIARFNMLVQLNWQPGKPGSLAYMWSMVGGVLVDERAGIDRPVHPG